MIKLCGGVLVFVAVAYCGFYLSDRLKKRRDFLFAMSDALSVLASEIEFGRTELRSIFKRLDNAPSLLGFFGQCAERSGNIRDAWAEAVTACADAASLKAEDADVLLRLGAQIGMSDVTGQKNAIARAVSGLDKNAQAADAEYLRLGKPYRSCGVLLGVFCLIIII